MFVVDTNILIYASDRSCPEYKPCKDLLESWRSQSSPWYITWGIIYEFLRVVTHPRVFKKPWNVQGAWRFIEGLLASSGLNILVETYQHPRVFQQILEEVGPIAGNLIFDLHIAALMREHGIEAIYTRDTDFYRFPFVRVIDPLK